MPQITMPELETLARSAANLVAGESSVEQVEVSPGIDPTGDPIYRFTFLIDQEHALQRAGNLRIRLHQKLRDDLLERGDDHYPDLQIIDRNDWEQRWRA